ncbi:DNA polymerase III subunit delta' [Paenibacillus methanolicus]|uniref:DNA polymerase III subunit delta' n=1 Tax=Paenibacillus methanolicus TaxID=582686 RepID=A0A5S5BLW4_9BACL|nr:DNA polymerase III subunit delta' [Paenibacillus methanolicus]TYP67974.1 DNA polymerase-3 subunit delta' [Paenibacillus methanolicus]
MSIAQLAGQPNAKRILQHALTTGKVSHAYLFSGPPGSGRLAMAEQFAKAIFCTSGTGDACGECLACRKFEHGNQPDLHIVEPDGNSIKIDQIRELQKDMAYRNSGTDRKVYIMKRAETMTLQAANSLLKFLEEPPTPVVAILLTDNGQAMLPTIRSRTQWVPFMPLSPTEMLEVLLQEGHPPTLARAAVHMASGLDACRAIVQQNGFAEMRNVVIQLGKDSLTRFTAAMLTAQQHVFKSELGEKPQLLLSLLYLWYRDFIQVQAGRQESVVFIDQIEFLSRHAYNRSSEGWVRCMEYTLETGKRMRAHVSPQLALEQLLIRIQEG